MLSHFRFALVMLLACGFASFASAQSSVSANAASAAARRASLKEQLELGLRIRRPQEFAFIGSVLTRVDQGHLSRQLVVETFAWARRKDPRAPFPYFVRALEERAKKAGTPLGIDTRELFPSAR